MLATLALTAPVYLLIAAGYAAVRFGVFAQAELRVLGRFVIQLALPALLFKALSQSHRPDGPEGLYLLAYAAGSLASLFLVRAWARHGRGQAPASATLSGLGAAASNSGLIGYPIVAQWLGPTAGLGLALCMLVENMLVIPLGLALADSASEKMSWRRALWQAAVNWSRHPMIIAIVLGFGCAMSGLTLPDWIARAVQILAAAASPVALFVIGGSLLGVRLEGQRQDVAGVALAKLLLHPACVLLALWLMPSVPVPLRPAGVLFAAMPMLSIYPLVAMKHGQEGRSAAILLVATIAAFVTISGWMWGLQQLPGWQAG
ncbi:AEC family transporter [Roseateles sp. BYS78W]|uniref:AEC family transporter n=1 Tax=Pelomonas candidula TaxID=3299025 RepID=A0ABW7HKE0_9BURK